jgi:hypothetical protein
MILARFGDSNVRRKNDRTVGLNLGDLDLTENEGRQATPWLQLHRLPRRYSESWP